MNPSNQQAKNALFKQLFSSIGNDFVVKSAFYCDYGFSILLVLYIAITDENAAVLQCHNQVESVSLTRRRDVWRVRS